MILLAIDYDMPIVLAFWILLGVAWQMSLSAVFESFLTSWKRHA